MARLARIVIPNLPHHVTQRGNRRQPVFFSDDDYQEYLSLLAHYTKQADVSVWAWCLMPNHVHLMLTPPNDGALRQALAETHRNYSRLINFRESWRGYLWQGRFASCPMDPAHTMMAARYIELNPVRAQLVQHPGDWMWSSAGAHLSGKSDGLTNITALGQHVQNWGDFLASGLAEDEGTAIRRGERTGRPLGDADFIAGLESQTGRALAVKKAGRKRKDANIKDDEGMLDLLEN